MKASWKDFKNPIIVLSVLFVIPVILLYFNIPATIEAETSSGGFIVNDRFKITISHTGHFYTETINVEINSAAEDAEIRYTSDGTLPTPDHGTIYTKPVHIPADLYNQGFTLRIIAYTENDESDVFTHTYFVHPDINSRFTTLVFNITTDPYNLYDFDYGIFVSGRLRADWREITPDEFVIFSDPANYNLRGRGSERPAYLEVFTQEGERVLNQPIGIRVNGGWSRIHAKKSIRLIPRSEYSPGRGTLAYEFFPGDTRVDAENSIITEYHNLVLRGGSNDRLDSYMREEFCQRLAQQAGILFAKNNRAAAVFINGEYYTFMWLQERFHDKYIAEKTGGGNRELIEIKEWSDMPVLRSPNNDNNFKRYAQIVDLDNYMLYYAFQVYIGNYDWPDNNKKIWRYLELSGEYFSPYYDGKYRMLFYDAEHSFGLNISTPEKQILHRIADITNDRHSASFAALMRREDMIEKFCSQLFDLMHTVFLYENIERTMHGLIEEFDVEIGVAINEGAVETTRRALAAARESILEFAGVRVWYVIDEMIEFFNLSGSTYSVNVHGSENAEIRLNTLVSKNNEKPSLYSTYFVEHEVELVCVPDPGYRFDHWEIDGVKYYEPVLTLNSSFGEKITASAVLSAER